VLTPAEIAATAATIAHAQRPDGAIPHWPGGPIDPWNHVEAAMGLDVAGAHERAASAYRWLAAQQQPDSSLGAESDTNFTAYLAVGARHHALCTGELDCWPAVARAMDFVLTRQEPTGQCRWRDGPTALLAGCASIHLSLGAAELLADEPRPDWAAARVRLAEAIRTRPDLFEPKPHSMDWYYPVLAGVVPATHLDARWAEFVVPDLGVRCVSDEPWVTGGETAELVLTLAAHGRDAGELFDCLNRLRTPDGDYWTGWQYANRVHWPAERTTWTAGAVLLANAAISGHQPTLDVFRSATIGR
jgi:hypothetical protein